MRYENKEITFNVNNYLTEEIETKKKAGGLVNALMGVNVSEPDFLADIHSKSIAETESVIDRAIKNAKEINEESIVIATINAMLDELGSNLRLRQYIYITKDLSVSQSTWLCGNGYFKKIYQISDIQIPCKDYYGYEHEEEWKEHYENGYLYIYEESKDDIKISLSNNFDDGVDYTKSYMEVISQALLQTQSKVEAKNDWAGYIDISSEDGKIDAELLQNEVCSVFLMQHGQGKIDRYDSRYEIDIEELNKVVEQLQA